MGKKAKKHRNRNKSTNKRTKDPDAVSTKSTEKKISCGTFFLNKNEIIDKIVENVSFQHNQKTLEGVQNRVRIEEVLNHFTPNIPEFARVLVSYEDGALVMKITEDSRGGTRSRRRVSDYLTNAGTKTMTIRMFPPTAQKLQAIKVELVTTDVPEYPITVTKRVVERIVDIPECDVVDKSGSDSQSSDLKKSKKKKTRRGGRKKRKDAPPPPLGGSGADNGGGDAARNLTEEETDADESAVTFTHLAEALERLREEYANAEREFLMDELRGFFLFGTQPRPSFFRD